MTLMKNEKNKSADSDLKSEKLKKYDARGVQTLFRSLSGNHYNLLKMIDNKARIMLTVNSIISSLLMGALFIAPDTHAINMGPGTRILIICCMLSMVFAILSMLPHRYFGKNYKKSGYKGTLYAQSFSKQTLEEFRGEFNRIMKRGQNIYDEMIDDLYFLGRIIAKKQRLLLWSSAIFLAGIITTIVYSLLTGVVSFS